MSIRMARRFFTALLAMAGLSAVLSAAIASAATDAAGGTEAAAQVAPVTAAVRLDGRVIVMLRGYAGYTAAERAAVVEDAITEFASQRQVPVSLLQLAESPRGTDIRAGSQRLLTITDADAALEGLSRPLLASAVLDVLSRAIESWREQRSPRLLVRHAAYAVIASIVLAIALWLVAGGLRRLHALVRLRASGHARTLRIGNFQLISVTRLMKIAQAAVGLLFWVAVLGLLYLYLQFVLPLFPWTKPVGMRLLQLVTEPLATLATATLEALPDLAFLVVLFVVVRYALKLARLFFLSIEHGSLHFEGFDAEWAMPTYKVARIFIVAFAIVVAYPYIPGSDSAAFKGVSVLLGVIFSLGSSSVIGNVLAGYTMTYRRAFRSGDRIKVDDIVGDVIDSRVLVTTLRTPKNELVVVPNSRILNGAVTNYSALARQHGLVLHTTVGIGYETPWRQVHAMLLQAASRTEGLRSDPPAFVLQQRLADFCVLYELNVHADDATRMPALYSALHANILDVFNEYGVQIMTPAYVSDPQQAKLVRPGDWYAAPAEPPAEAPATTGDSV